VSNFCELVEIAVISAFEGENHLHWSFITADAGECVAKSDVFSIRFVADYRNNCVTSSVRFFGTEVWHGEDLYIHILKRILFDNPIALDTGPHHLESEIEANVKDIRILLLSVDREKSVLVIYFTSTVAITGATLTQ
jgi:hypothetical protein